MGAEQTITVAEVSDGEEAGRPVELPVLDVLTGRAFLTGKSGSGKSNSISVVAEKLLDSGFGLLVVDVEGEYYGLKEEYEILHAGADEECDIRVSEEHAEKLASLALEQNVPIILDLSGFLDEEEAEALLTAVARHLFAKAKKVKQPFLTIVEEIHEYVPEGGGMGECGRMLVKVAKRGRKHGLGIAGISQRPADVKKDFITQCDWLVWHRLTWQNDTRVVKRVLGSEYADDIEDMADGEAFLRTDWNEDVRRVQFHRKETFDAGATPGLDDFERPDLKSVSGDLVAELQEISEEQARREDRIAELEAKLEERDQRIEELEDELAEARDLSRMAEQFARAMSAEAGGSCPQPTQTSLPEYADRPTGADAAADTRDEPAVDANDDAATADARDVPAADASDDAATADARDEPAADASDDATTADASDEPAADASDDATTADASDDAATAAEGDAGDEGTFRWRDLDDLAPAQRAIVEDAAAAHENGTPDGEPVAVTTSDSALDDAGVTADGKTTTNGGAASSQVTTDGATEKGVTATDGPSPNGEAAAPNEGEEGNGTAGTGRRASASTDGRDGDARRSGDGESGGRIVVPDPPAVDHGDRPGDGDERLEKEKGNSDDGTDLGVGEDSDDGTDLGVGEDSDDGTDLGVGEDSDDGTDLGVGEDSDDGISLGVGEDSDDGGIAFGADGDDEGPRGQGPDEQFTIEIDLDGDGRDAGDDGDDASGPNADATAAEDGGDAEAATGSAGSLDETTTGDADPTPAIPDPPVLARRLRDRVAALDDHLQEMLVRYRADGPARPEAVHEATGGSDEREAAYRHNRKLRKAGLVAHVGQGRYDYALPSLLDAVPGDLDDQDRELLLAEAEAPLGST